MRKLIAIAAVALLVLGCSGPSAADPYALVDRSASASYGAVQINVGLSGTSGGSAVSIDPQAIQVILDGKAGKAAFHLALPVSALGAEAASLGQFGITGDTLAIDVVFDGAGLYAKGELVTSLLTLLLAQTGQQPGDLSGWVRLGTAAEFATLFGQLAPGGAVPSAGPMASHDAASIKKALEDAGITLTIVGAEKRNGRDANHLAAAVDVSKLEASSAFQGGSAAQLQQLKATLDQVNVSADLWLDTSSNRLNELDVHVTPKDGAGDKADLAILVSEPSDTSALTAPATFTEVSLAPIIQTLLQSFGQGLLGG